MTKLLRVLVLVILIIGGISTLTFFTYDKLGDDAFQGAFNDKYGIYALQVPVKIKFAGEEIPFKDPEIYERFDRELLVNTYWQSQTMLFFKRANRYFDIIEPILKKNGVPDDFKYLAVVESGLMNVVSPAGATGVWQIMEATGKDHGLEINKEVDERYHLEKSTEAACAYLKQAKKELGSWTLAAASYNMGIGGIRKQLKRQSTNSYYGLTLNSETERYVFRILAAKEIMSNPQKYGFHFREKDLYKVIPTTSVEIDTAVTSFGQFADKLGINYRILKYHNPWLRYDYLPNSSRKKYTIKIPKDGYFALSDDELADDVVEEVLDTIPLSAPVVTDTIVPVKTRKKRK